MTARPSLSARLTLPSDGHRLALQRAVWYGMFSIPLFGLLDVFTKHFVYPKANLHLIFSLRFVATLAATGAWWIARDSRFSYRAARIAHALCLAIVAASITGMANEFGGPTSLYMQGLTIIVMVRSAAVPAPARETFFHGGLVALVYPLGFALLFYLDPSSRAHWLSREVLAPFAVEYAMVAFTMGCGCFASHARWAAQHQLYQARKLGRYRLEAQIGSGGQNEVWLAWDGTLKRNVALKILRASRASADALRLFEREALLASQLESPHTVRIYDFGASDDGVYYLAMEHLVGADLGALIKSHGPMPAARVVWFGIQACRSLEEAHDKGLVHRDVKPSNLFALNGEARYDVLKLLDFGVARSFLDATDDFTRTGALRGTPAYLAPECVRGETVTPSVDIYGLGATLYHLLVGAPPFAGSEAELINQHLTHEPIAPSLRTGREVPGELEHLILACLTKSPAARPASAREVRRALEACRDAGHWSHEQAARFWSEERHGTLERWQADTVV